MVFVQIVLMIPLISFSEYNFDPFAICTHTYVALDLSTLQIMSSTLQQSTQPVNIDMSSLCRQK
jgi:hypothetical protein